MSQHSFTWKLNGVPNFICIHCGLMKLNNDFTKWCISQGCDYRDHPLYQTMRKTLVKR